MKRYSYAIGQNWADSRIYIAYGRTKIEALHSVVFRHGAIGTRYFVWLSEQTISSKKTFNPMLQTRIKK